MNIKDILLMIGTGLLSLTIRNIMKTLIIFLLLLTTGCSILGQGIEKAAEVNDKALDAAQFTICNGASIGSIKRRFNTPELAKLWREICEEKQGFTP